MRSESLIDLVDIDHYVMPTLQLILGIVNYLYKKMVEEAQADFEGYSLDSVKAGKDMGFIKVRCGNIKY